MKRLAIIGGGMAGCIAGIVAANNNLKIDIYERQDEILKKILLTGNGRCNISNQSIDISDYYTDCIDKLSFFLNQFDNNKEIEFWNSLGIILKEKNGCLYPYTGQALTVRNIIINHLKNRKINIKCNSLINYIEKKNDGYIVDGCFYDYCIISCGGMAGVYKEQENNGYSILRKFKIPYDYCYPGLVQVKCKSDIYKKLKGIRCDAKISLKHESQNIMDTTEWILSENGELQITETGLSGIAVFQLSRYIGVLLKNKIRCRLIVNLLYNLEKTYIIDNFQKYKEAYPFSKIFDYLQTFVNTKILECIFENTLDLNTPVQNISTAAFEKILDSLSNWTHDIKELNPFKNAQVSCGGLSINNVDNHFMLKDYDNLFVLGEMLNVTGKCGGYNLHFATLSGYSAGKYIKELVINA